jgi:hypothetical protein
MPPPMVVPCPECGTRLRLPRAERELTVTCPRCRAVFPFRPPAHGVATGEQSSPMGATVTTPSGGSGIRARPYRRLWFGLAAVGLVLASVLGWAVGRGGGRVAIERVYAADRDLSRERDAAAAAAKYPSEVAAAIRRYRERLGAVDTAGCPADFRAAYRRHMRAWEEVEGVVAARPDGVLAELLTGALNGFLKGELDGGAGRMDRDLKAALGKVRDSWEEVERVGAAHGVVPPDH